MGIFCSNLCSRLPSDAVVGSPTLTALMRTVKSPGAVIYTKNVKNTQLLVTNQWTNFSRVGHLNSRSVLTWHHWSTMYRLALRKNVRVLFPCCLTRWKPLQCSWIGGSRISHLDLHSRMMRYVDKNHLSMYVLSLVHLILWWRQLDFKFASNISFWMNGIFQNLARWIVINGSDCQPSDV